MLVAPVCGEFHIPGARLAVRASRREAPEATLYTNSKQKKCLSAHRWRRSCSEREAVHSHRWFTHGVSMRPYLLQERHVAA